ncbi:MAG: DUF2341 domain-containing protein [Desulfobacterales bacterium]
MNCLQGRTATDSDTPGASTWVVFEDITSSPYDLRLKDNAENDAQDAHTDASGAGISMPADDINGTSRPYNSNYDIGADEFVSGGDWYNDSCWQYRKKLTLDSSQACADLTDFPVLISFTNDSDLASGPQCDFDDVLFTSANGTTKLSHEIEDFNGTNGDIVAWVKIPLLQSTTDTEIYMYYGCGTAEN